MNEQMESRHALARAERGTGGWEFILQRVRVLSAAKSIGFALLLSASALALTGCPGGIYETGYSSGYYSPNYAGYYGSYGYGGAPYGYGGIGSTFLIGGVSHRGYYGRHHYFGERRHSSRGRGWVHRRHDGRRAGDH